MIIFGRLVPADAFPHLDDAALLAAIRNYRQIAHATADDHSWSRLHALTLAAQARRLNAATK